MALIIYLNMNHRLVQVLGQKDTKVGNKIFYRRKERGNHPKWELNEIYIQQA